jgi:hypothetical protein
MSYKIDEILDMLLNISERLDRIEDALGIDEDFDEDELEETLAELDKKPFLTVVSNDDEKQNDTIIAIEQFNNKGDKKDDDD